MIRSPLKNEFWNSLLSSGELKNIRDFDLLYAVTEAYAQVAILRVWEDRLAGIVTGSGSTIAMALSDGRFVSMFANVYSWVVPTFATAEDAITRARQRHDSASRLILTLPREQNANIAPENHSMDCR
jgi:hypothetical protein